MTIVGSADITVDLLDASYQQKKRAIAIDLGGLAQKRSIPVDLESDVFEQKRAKIQSSLNNLSRTRVLADVTRDYASRNNTQAQYEQASYEIAVRGANERVAIAEAESRRLAIATEKARQPVVPVARAVPDSINRVNIPVDLLDASFQQKKRAINIDLVGLEQKRSVFVDLESDVFEQKRAKIQSSLNDLSQTRALVGVTTDYAKRNITQAQYEQASYEIAQRGADERVAIADAESKRLAILIQKSRLPVERVPVAAAVPNYINKAEISSQYSEARLIIEREQKLFSNRRQAFEAELKKGNIVNRYEYAKGQESSVASISAARRRITELQRSLFLSSTQTSSAQIQTVVVASKKPGETEDVLVTQLIASQKQSAKARLEIEQNRIKREAQLLQEELDYYKAASIAVADVVKNGIESEIGASNRRLSSLSITNTQLQLTKTAFDQQSSSQRTAIGLMEQYADVALRQSKELQNLSALSKTPVGSAPLVRREIVTQLREITGKSNFADLRLPGLNADQTLLVRRQQQEDAIAQTQSAALDAQLNQKRAGLQLDAQSQAIAQARAEQEARVTLLKAQQNKVTARQQLFEAEIGIDALPSNVSARDRIVARNRLNNAQAQFNLADQGVGLAEKGLNAQGAFAQVQQQIAQRILQDFGVESKATRELFNLKDAARERGQSLELATQGIDPTRFNRRGSGINVSDRTQPFVSPDKSTGLVQNQSAAVGIAQLVTLAQQTYAQNRQMLTELQVIATRSPVTLVGTTPAPSRILRDNKL